MQDNKNFFRSQTLLSLALGIFLMITGAQALAQHQSSLLNSVTSLLGVPHEPPFLRITFGILEFLSGLVMFLTPFGILQPNIAGVAIFTVALVWLAKIILESFVISKPFTPDGFIWWKQLSLNVVILVSIWHLRPREIR